MYFSGFFDPFTRILFLILYKLRELGGKLIFVDFTEIHSQIQISRCGLASCGAQPTLFWKLHAQDVFKIRNSSRYICLIDTLC